MALSFGGRLIALWGLIGILALLAQAIRRLAPLALEPMLDGSFATVHWVACALWTAFNGYTEGYRGFQKSFSPRVAARAVHLARHPRPLFVLLAPAYCMALFHANRRNLIVAWAILVGVTLLVIFVRTIPQPWRGIIDAGVVVGLVWGAIATVVHWVRAIFFNLVPEDAGLPT